MFERTRLYTPEGGFVTEVDLPRLPATPEVLIWGARVFIYVDSFLDLTEDEDGCYVEAFAYYVPPYPPSAAPAPYVDNIKPAMEEYDRFKRGEERPIVTPDPDLCREGMPSPEEIVEGMDLLEATYGKCPACNRVDGKHMPDCPNYTELPAPDHYVMAKDIWEKPLADQLDEAYAKRREEAPPRRVRMIGEAFTCGYCMFPFSFMGLDRNPQDGDGVTYCTAEHLLLSLG